MPEFTAFLLLAAFAAPSAPLDIADYDTHLCRTAQRLIVNAGDELAVIEQRASGNGFHTIQMAVDTDQDAAVIAMTTIHADTGGVTTPAYVACKMVNRERINASLQRDMPGPDRQCRAVNEHTLSIALAQLSPAARERYRREGRQLQFADDVIIATGGEWLPLRLDGFITSEAAGPVTVAAPSVRVPWDPVEQNFYQGTQHCKLLSLASMYRWVSTAAFSDAATLIPATGKACTAPSSMSSAVGSCRFYFAPAGGLFCLDYSGRDWTRESAQQECAARHASAEALQAADNRYQGSGGVFSDSACAARSDNTAITGTCVFNCQAGDETLWHLSGRTDPRLTRGCDLFVEAALAAP